MDMEKDPSDADLMEAFNKGDEEALSLLINRYKGPLFAYLLRLSGDRDAADDIFQDVFVKVVKKASSYREHKKFSAWLFTVAHHSLMDHFRSVSRRREDSLDAVVDGGLSPGDRLPSPEPGPERVLERTERSRTVQAAFDRLSPEQREVFALRHYSGLSFKEIADIYGVPIGTVLARMSRTLAKLRRELNGEGCAP